MSSTVKLEFNPLSSDSWIIKEIQAMMHGFGDCSSPLLTTSRLIQEVMLKQLQCAVQQATEVAALRGSVILKAEDFIFLMRKDPVKVKRLLKYLDVKNMKMNGFNKLDGALNDSDPDLLDLAMINILPSKRKHKEYRGSTVKHERLLRANRISSSSDNSKYAELSHSCRTSDNLGALNDSDPDLLDVSTSNAGPWKRRRNRDFSTSSNGDQFDAVKHERLVRADHISSSLDNTKYAEFTRSRRASFTNNANKITMLHDEVLKPMKDLPQGTKLNKSACDILGYFAYETVAQIVDLAFLVRQDAANETNDPFSRYTSALTIHPSRSANIQTGTVGSAPPLSPSEVREALRRYWSPRFSPFNSSSQLHKRLLVC